MRRVTLRTGLGVVIAAAMFAGAPPAIAQVSIVQEPERPTLFYSADSEQDCSALHALDSAQLPYNVVRLRAQVTAGVDSYQWSLPKPQVGLLLADDDLGPQDTTAAVRGFCAEFGNSCILTKQSLKFYNKDTILYAAPTCDVLPRDTSRVFPGDSVAIKLTTRTGKKKSKAVTQVRWGDPTVAGVTLYTNNQSSPLEPREAFDGIGKKSAQGFLFTSFNATESPIGLPGLPAIASFDFSFGSLRGSSPACPPEPANICVTLGEAQAGNNYSTVKARLADGSALCDALNVNVGACPRKAQVQVIRVPSKRSYQSGDAARLRVRFANLSPNDPGCGLLLIGSNVLSCSATFKIGKIEDVKTDRWDLQHCSISTGQPCVQDSDCGCRTVSDCPCPDCEPNEVCLTESHCSETFTHLCSANSDCEQPACPGCQDDETCVRVLQIPAIAVEPGQAVDLVDTDVVLKNEIGSPVSVKETWTANASPNTSADAAIKYTIQDAN